jgi:hypothetical protein
MNPNDKTPLAYFTTNNPDSDLTEQFCKSGIKMFVSKPRNSGEFVKTL